MAINPALPELEITVNVDGQPLREYEDDDIDGSLHSEPLALRQKAVSKYVEAVTDQEFSIDLTLCASYEPTSPSLTARVYADGEWISGEIFHTSGILVGLKQTRSTKGPMIFDAALGKDMIHHMKFASITTSMVYQSSGSDTC